MCVQLPVFSVDAHFEWLHSPYYIWLGRSRSADVSRFLHAFEVESGNTIGNMTPRSFKAMKAAEETATVPELTIGEPALDFGQDVTQEQGVIIDVSPPLSSFHYQVKNVSETLIRDSINQGSSTLYGLSSRGGCLTTNKPSIRNSGLLSMPLPG